MNQASTSASEKNMPPPKISIVIINYNSGTRLVKCLEHLMRQTLRDFDVCVLDNASTDDSMLGVENVDLPVKIIRSPENLGFAAGNNQAVREAKGKWLAFLNPDAYPETGWLQSLITATEKYPWAEAFGSTQIDALNPEKLDGIGDVYHVFGVPYRGGFGQSSAIIPLDGECFSPCAAAALYKRKVFTRLGGFDERYFCYGEDVDLGFRLRLAGGRAIQVSNAVVHHEGSAVSGRYSDFTVYHGNRNRIWGWFLNMPLVLLIPLLPFHLLVNAYLLARSFSVGIGKPFWRAMIDGYGGLGIIWKARKERQQNRIVRISDLAYALTWSPIKVSRRASDLKPISKD